MSDPALSTKPSAETLNHNPFAIAVGLMLNDLAILPLLLLVLAIPSGLELLAEIFDVPTIMGSLALDRIAQIGVMSFIVLRWRKRLQSSQGQHVRTLPVLARISVISFLTGFVISTPLFGATLGHQSALAALFIALFVIGCVWCLRMYFFFAVAGMLGLPLGRAFAKSIELARHNSGLIIRSLIAPCAITFFVTTLFLMPYPDGRSASWLAASSAAEGLFWILSSYVALGFALTMFTEHDWRSAGLSHYRADRLNTLQTQAGKTLPKYLQPRFGLIMLVVSLFFLAGNWIRLGQLPPAGSVVLKAAQVGDYTIRVELQVEDREFRFRGFQPQALFVATKTGSALSTRLISASLKSGSNEVIPAIHSREGEPTLLYLSFESTKTGQTLAGLDNMWLWYRAHPLLPIAGAQLQPSESSASLASPSLP